MKSAGTFLVPLAIVAGIALPREASAQGTVTASAEREPLAGSVPSERGAKPDADHAWAEREAKLNEGATLGGGVGLLHTQHAQGGAAGQFRLAFTTEYGAADLCSTAFPCRDPRNASNRLFSGTTDHFGGRLSLSMQVLSWLEPYLATSALANSNPANRPGLLQVLGDTTLGAKAHGALSKVLHVGGAFELNLLNGTGAVGLDGGGTGAKFRAMATADLRGMEKRVPFRFSTNLTYVLDNSGELVTTTETARGEPITRIERFGLAVNRVDHFDIHLGAEFFAAEDRVRPFLEYRILVPVNRQDYRCRPNNPSSDKCLANDAFAPSTFTLGGRFFPWKKGFNLLVALDLGVSGKDFFIEEMSPTPTWMFYLGAGWAFDTQDRPPVRALASTHGGLGSGRKIRGFVHEEASAGGVASAIVAWENHPELTSLATGTDGRFTTQELPPGPYTFSVRAEGYKPAQCTTTLGGTTPDGTTTPSAPAPPDTGGGGDVQLDCLVQALPRVGAILGKVKDLETGKLVPNAPVKVVDVARKELSGTTDDQGSFRFELLTPGESTVVIDADGYLLASEKLEIKPRQDNPIEISLKKKPKNALVAVQSKEIVIRQQVQFAVDSATILPASTALLTEIADVLVRNPRIKRVEVQGHTDGTGNPTHNMKLSDDRAMSVAAWLTAHGVAADRLTAKGYGDSKPLVPNVTDLNRQRNRRVQFIIADQDAATPAPALGAPSLGSGAKPTPKSPVIP